jgi:Holliday junction resolvase
MNIESRLQSEIRKFLKSKGCDVLVIKPQPGIPDGWEDITFFKEGFYGMIEVKDSPTAKYQPLQKERIKKHNEWSWAKRVDPSNWQQIQVELEFIL